MPPKSFIDEASSTTPLKKRGAGRVSRRPRLTLSDLIDFVERSSEDDIYDPGLKRNTIVIINIRVEGDIVSCKKTGNENNYKANVSRSSEVSIAQGMGVRSSVKARDRITAGSAAAIDLKTLVSELDQLRVAMRAEARELENDEAIASVVQAQKAAETGNEASVMDRLKSAGKWGLGIAEKLALTAASEAIKKAMTL